MKQIYLKVHKIGCISIHWLEQIGNVPEHGEEKETELVGVLSRCIAMFHDLGEILASDTERARQFKSIFAIVGFSYLTLLLW